MLGSRTLRNMFRKRVARLHERRHPAAQARPDARLPDDARLGRARRRCAASRVVGSDEAAGARCAAGRERDQAALGLVLGLGRLERRRDRSRQAAAACVYLWARDPSSATAPRPRAGLQRLAHRGPARASAGAHAARSRPAGRLEIAISDLTPVTGDRGRRVHCAPSRALIAELLRAELKAQAGLGRRAGGRGAAASAAASARYRAALAKAHASPGAARGVIGDELRRPQIEARHARAGPSSDEFSAFYDTYLADDGAPGRDEDSGALARRPPSAASRSSPTAPPQLFSIPEGRRLQGADDDGHLRRCGPLDARCPARGAAARLVRPRSWPR